LLTILPLFFPLIICFVFKCLGSTGTITGIDQDNDVEVTYPSGNKWTFNPAVLTVVGSKENPNYNHSTTPTQLLNNSYTSATTSSSNMNQMNSINLQMNDLSRKTLDFRFKFSVNEFVEICSDLEAIKSLQRGHGEWADDMIPVNIRLESD
jgi:E3 ubiquitin-protein ligase mind-bomb